MRELSLDEFASQWAKIEQAVDATPGIDPWCSGPDWILSVNAGFAPKAPRVLLEADDDAGFVSLARYRTASDRSLLGCLEPLWGFGSPVVGSDLDSVTKSLVEYLRLVDDWDLAYLTGFPADTCPPKVADSDPLRPDATTIQIAKTMTALGTVSLRPGIVRQVANLDSGYDAWLANRSSTFRRNLRKATRRAEDVGLSIIDVVDDTQLFGRLLAIEHQTWKGKEDSGITSTEMQRMYSTIVDRLAERGRLMAHVAQLNGEDVGYILGGLRNRRYRGLQLSYVDGHDTLSIGNILQDHQIQLLCTDQAADAYDLGMDFGYKRSWADQAERSVAIVIQPERH